MYKLKIMEEKENIIDELKKIYPDEKKKKKFVYLDKYEIYKEITDTRLHSLERSLNACYIGIGILAVCIVLIVILK